jgi:hypothetical protein
LGFAYKVLDCGVAASSGVSRDECFHMRTTEQFLKHEDCCCARRLKEYFRCLVVKSAAAIRVAQQQCVASSRAKGERCDSLCETCRHLARIICFGFRMAQRCRQLQRPLASNYPSLTRITYYFQLLPCHFLWRRWERRVAN